MFGEGVGAGLDLLVGGFDLGGLKGRLADELGVAGWGERYMMTPMDQTSTS